MPEILSAALQGSRRCPPRASLATHHIGVTIALLGVVFAFCGVRAFE